MYISEEPDNKEYVIDGQQRLTSFFSFLDGKFPDGGDFKLTGLQVFSELNGKAYIDLDDGLQDTVRYCKLRTVTFRRESDENLKFEIFERLNTGSVPLNDQELRNCIYRGSYNDLVHELSGDPDFKFVLGLAKPDKRRKDLELVLRFCAFFNATYLKYKPPMKVFLNNDASVNRDISPEAAKKLRTAFKNACQITRSMFGTDAFKRFYRGSEKNPNGYWEPKKFNASLYDIVMYTFAQEDKNTIFGKLDSVREALIDLMTENQDFIGSIELSTSSVQAVRKRFDLWRGALEHLVGTGAKEPRCFTRELKEVLFKADPTCAICRQRIDHVDDAAVDHIEQYWTGGKTIPENARLAHRYCNWSRPITNQDCTAYYNLRLDSDAAISTVNGEMACLKSLFSEAARAGLVQTNPVKGIKLLNPNNSRDRILSSEETARLFDAAAKASDFVRPLFHLLFHTGMRLGEALALEWIDVEVEHERIVVRQSKSGEGRKVPLRPVLAIELIRWKPHAGGSRWVFPARYDSSTPMQSIRKGWLRLCANAGVANLTPHDLRHNFTSVLQARGVADSIIMSITGHKTHVMLHRYSHSADESKRSAVEVMPAPIHSLNQTIVPLQRRR